MQNALIKDKFFKGWILRVYTSEEIPLNYIDEMTQHGIEVVKISKQQEMFGRFLVATDPTVDRYIVRDSDSRLNTRERSAINIDTSFKCNRYAP